MQITLLIRGRLREGTFVGGAGAVPARGFALRSRAALGIMSFGTTAEAWGASTGLGQARAAHAAGTKSQETWPGAELGGQSPNESRSRAPEGERTPMQIGCASSRNLVCGAQPRPKHRQRQRLLVLRGPNELAPFGALLPLFCRGRIFLVRGGWQSSGASASRERSRASASAK